MSCDPHPDCGAYYRDQLGETNELHIYCFDGNTLLVSYKNIVDELGIYWSYAPRLQPPSPIQ